MKVTLQDLNRLSQAGFEFMRRLSDQERKQFEIEIEKAARVRGISGKLRRRRNDPFLISSDGFDSLEEVEDPSMLLTMEGHYGVYVEHERLLFEARFRGTNALNWQSMPFGPFEVFIEITKGRYLCVPHDDLPIRLLSIAP